MNVTANIKRFLDIQYDNLKINQSARFYIHFDPFEYDFP